MIKNFYQSEPSVRWFLTPDGFDSLLALVGRNGQGVGTSPLSQWVKTVEKLKLKKEEKDELDKVSCKSLLNSNIFKIKFLILIELHFLIIFSSSTKFTLKSKNTLENF